MFEQEGLFARDEGQWPWRTPWEKLRRNLMDEVRREPLADVDDVDVAVALAQLLNEELMAFGTEGSHRLDDRDVALVVRSLKAVLLRVGIQFDLPWREFTSFKTYWLAHDGYRSWAARRQMVATAFEPVLALLYARQDDRHVGRVVDIALDALPDASAVHEHLGRLASSIDSDPRLAVSVAKDLIESTAKLVLREVDIPHTRSDEAPQLVARAQEALRLHAAGVAGDSEEAAATKALLGSVGRLAVGVVELRNKIGVGHGRESAPGWIRPRHARLAADAAATWCNLMLETLGDPESPWRRSARN